MQLEPLFPPPPPAVFKLGAIPALTPGKAVLGQPVLWREKGVSPPLPQFLRSFFHSFLIQRCFYL